MDLNLKLLERPDTSLTRDNIEGVLVNSSSDKFVLQDCVDTSECNAKSCDFRRLSEEGCLEANKKPLE
jgi:hypothetical protein